MEDLADFIASYIEENVKDRGENGKKFPYRLEAEILASSDSDGACIRHDPTPAAERRFIDGSRLVVWNFAIFVRCQNALDALKWARLVINFIDGKELDISGLKVTLEAQSLPQFVDSDTLGFTVYTATFTVKYMQA